MLTKRMPMIRFFTGDTASLGLLLGVPSDTGACETLPSAVRQFYPNLDTYTETTKAVVHMAADVPALIHANFNMAKAFDMMGLPVNTDDSLLPQKNTDSGTSCPPTKQAILSEILPGTPVEAFYENPLEQPNTIGQDILEHLQDSLSSTGDSPFTDIERLFSGLELLPMYE